MSNEEVPRLEQLFRLGAAFDMALKMSGMTREEFIDEMSREAAARQARYDKIVAELYPNGVPAQEEIDAADRKNAEIDRKNEQRARERKQKKDAKYADLTSQVMERLNQKNQEDEK